MRSAARPPEVRRRGVALQVVTVMGADPRAVRKNLLLSATIKVGALRAPVRIRNLSESGAMIDGAALPEAGTALVLRRLEVEIGARAVWRRAGRCGITFDGTVSVEDWVSGIRPPYRSPDSDAAHVEEIETGIPGGAKLLPENGPASNVQIDSELIERRIAEELVYVGRLLDAVGEEFTNDPIILQRHDRALQNIHAASQILAHLGTIVTSDDRTAAVNAVTLRELRARLLRK